jgi:predicted metal-binding protein
MDSIAYEVMKEEPREVWKCLGKCGRFRHRRALPGLAPAICCGEQARLFDRYSQPIEIEIEERIVGAPS